MYYMSSCLSLASGVICLTKPRRTMSWLVFHSSSWTRCTIRTSYVCWTSSWRSRGQRVVSYYFYYRMAFCLWVWMSVTLQSWLARFLARPSNTWRRGIKDVKAYWSKKPDSARKASSSQPIVAGSDVQKLLAALIKCFPDIEQPLLLPALTASSQTTNTAAMNRLAIGNSFMLLAMFANRENREGHRRQLYWSCASRKGPTRTT